MSLSLSVEGPGDAELISAVRGGDVDAYGELFARHVESARRLARQLAGPGESDDLVSDAFTKVLSVLQRGGGPDLAFRAYLLTAVRRLHVDRIRAGSRLRPVDDLAPFDPGLPFHDTAVEGFDNAAAARAFASLPERWQMVLWHTEVEQQKPADIAPLLGMSANSVSALAYRAREGLRQAFLSQHASDPDDVDCAWTRDHLGAYVRGGLSRRDAARVDDHLAACRACAAVYLELTEVNSGLAALLAPLLLGSAGVGYLSGGGAGSSVISGGFAAAKTWAASHASMTAVGGMVVTASAVLTIYGASQLNNHGGAGLASPSARDRLPIASSQPTTGSDLPNPKGSSGNRTGPGGDRGVGPRVPSPSRAPRATPPPSDASTAPVVPPITPLSQPTNPSTSPTDPTTGPPEPVGPLTFDSTAPIHPAIGSTYRVSASGGSGGPITFSVDAATTHAACSIGGSVVTFDHAGSCVIAAEESGNRTASRAGDPARATQRIDVPQTAQTVTFTSQPPGNPVVDGTYHVGATSTSGRSVTFATNQACSVSGSTVTFVHADDCVVTATQSGNADLASASATQTLRVAKGAQNITFTSTAHDPAVDGTYQVEAQSSAGLPVTFSLDPSTPAQACSLSGSTVTFTHVGTCVIAADQAGNNDYEPAPTKTQSLVVGEYDLTVTATPVLDGKGNPQRIQVTVSGLPSTGTAELTATGPKDLHTIAGANCPCAVQGPAQTFFFTYNTQQSPTATVTFSVSTADSPDPVGGKPDTVTLEFPMASALRSFWSGIQP